MFGADAVVHLGKHGNLEWLPGKTLGMSAACGADAALGNLPLIYPFLVNDPGEGTQAKRRAHATLVDHLIPPMARAETYGDIARLEQLLDEHANIAALDPGKLPAHPSADLDADARREDGPRPRPGRAARGRLVRRHAAARRRLAVRDQGRPDPRRPAHPRRKAHRRMSNSIWCWPSCGHGSCSAASRRCRGCARRSAWPRTATTTAPPSTPPRPRARELVAALQQAGWDAEAVDTTHRRPRRRRASCGSPPPRWCRGWQARPAEIDQILRALGRPVHRGRAVGLTAARPGQRAAHRPQLLLGRPQGGAVPAGVGNRCGDGGFAAGPLPRRLRPLAAVGRAVGVGHLGDAHLGRRHRRSACAAGCPAGLGRRVAAGRRPGADPAGRTRQAAHRRDRAHLRLLPRRLPARGHHARRRGATRRGPRRARRRQLRPRPRAGRPRRAR